MVTNVPQVKRRRVLAMAAVAAALLATAGTAPAAPEARLWPRWQAHAAGAAGTVDHAAWSAVLARHVRPGADGIARFDYRAAKQDDGAAVAGYVEALAGVAVSDLDRPEQMAFWINLYNALTVRVVLDHYPVASIRDIDISPGLFANGPWGRRLVTVEGIELSLDDIEHRILRPIWRDPRIHYAVNCASLGCPDLAGAAFTAATLEPMLEAAARAYVNHPRGASVEGGRLVVSSIYDWFGEDFGGEAGVIAHLRRYAAPPLAAALAGITRIADDRYDWRLNDVDR